MEIPVKQEPYYEKPSETPAQPALTPRLLPPHTVILLPKPALMGNRQLHLCKGQKMDALAQFSLTIVGQAPKYLHLSKGNPPLSVLAPLFLPPFMLNAIRRLSPALTGTKHTGMQL